MLREDGRLLQEGGGAGETADPSLRNGPRIQSGDASRGLAVARTLVEIAASGFAVRRDQSTGGFYGSLAHGRCFSCPLDGIRGRPDCADANDRSLQRQEPDGPDDLA